MVNFDISSLQTADREFTRITETITEKYKCDWDDPVHESYGPYVKQMTAAHETFHSICGKAEDTVREMRTFDLEQTLKQADHLCEEAYRI